MKLTTFAGTSALLLGFLLSLGVAVPSYAQDQQEEKPKKQEPAKQQEAKPEHEGQPKQQAEQPHPEKEAKPPKQQQAEQPKTEKSSKQAEKQNDQQLKDQEKAQKQQEKAQKEQQKVQQKQYGQQRGYSQQNGQQSAQESRGGHGGRIPEDHFRQHFGREHHFHIGHPQVVEGRPQFAYGGYTFIIVQAWPSDWNYDDDVYIVDDGGIYYLCDDEHPDVQVELTVVL